MTSSKWQVTPTTADIGFVAESPTIPGLFIVSSVALQCIRLGFEPDEHLPLSTGETITIVIDKSERIDRDLVAWLEEINWVAESKSAVIHIHSVRYEEDKLLSEGTVSSSVPVEPVIEIKAVTFHELELSSIPSVAGGKSGYRAKVILDV